MFSSTRDDRFHLAAFEKRDHAVAAVPDSIFRSPDFVGFDFSTTHQHYHRFAALAGSQTWSTGRDWITRGACVGSCVCGW